jgi:diguanylate cyclase (GGDEF)-like protein
LRLFQKFNMIHSTLFDSLEQRSRKSLFAWSLGLLVLMGALDSVTGNYSFTLFYLIPIFFAAWFVGSLAGVSVCIGSFFSSLLANPYRYVLRHYSHPTYYYWDLFLEFTYLLLMSLMFSALKERFNLEREMSRVDPLTGALNRRALMELATYEIAQCSRHLRSLNIAFIDLDNFKLVNDRMGHAEGDKVLCEVVAAFGEILRKTDVIARVGGDEFVIMLPETDEESAGAVIRKVRENLLASMARNGWPVTFSIGFITYESPSCPVEEMIAKADRLMYSIKNTHKNDIIHHVERRERMPDVCIPDDRRDGSDY